MRRSLPLVAAGVGALVLVASAAWAEPFPAAPGTYPTTNGSGGTSTATDFLVAVGSDASDRLYNNLADVYNSQASATDPKILSYDAVNPLTGAAGETIHAKPGCDFARPNGANAGVTALKGNQTSSASVSNPNPGDGLATSFCIDIVRNSRAKKTDGTESALTYYDLTRDAVTWTAIAGGYAPDAPLTTVQLRDIFECNVTNWAQVGGQYGDIHVYVPPTSAGTYTFFLQSIGSSVANVTAGCGSAARATQQNDGTKTLGDPQGIAPYAVTKWAAQANAAPGTPDLRGGVALGRVPLSDGSSVPPLVTYSGTSYLVLNPEFAKGTATASSTQGRLLYTTLRNTAPFAASLFGTAGWVCAHEDTLLPPFGAIPLGTDTSQTEYCGKPG